MNLPWFVLIPFGFILFTCAVGVMLLVLDSIRRTPDDEIESWINGDRDKRRKGYITSQGRNMPPRSPSREKRGW